MSEQENIKNGVIFNKQEKRFYSRMPWKSSPSLLRNNKHIAIAAHQNMKKKAHKHPDHPSMIKDTFQSMLDNQFIIKTENLPSGNGKSDGLRTHIMENTNCHFTVNTIVFKPSSQSTKTRITWDATRKTSKKGPSLNSLLMKGFPQYNISKMIINWRLKAFALSTDISKFFNRIAVDPIDRPYLNILWTESMEVEEVPQWYSMLVHTFGYQSTSAIA